jgi:hypothetical protein
MANIKPGGMGSGSDPNTKPPEFAGSMAEAIEDALNELLGSEQPPMKTFAVDTNSPEARDRRRLFVAITLGMMRYLQHNMDGFQIFDPSNNPTGEGIVMNTDPNPL